MPKAIDLAGETFGKLVAIGLAPPGALTNGSRAWTCRCACGGEIPVATQGLLSGRVTACPDCGGPKPKRKATRACAVCGNAFPGGANSMVCSAECREARRRGVRAGVESLPPPSRECDVCRKPFRAYRNAVACSEACRRERKRRLWREDYHARVATDPDLGRRNHERRRERAASDPEFAKRLAAWERKRHERHKRRMADPAYAERHRERARACYRAHAGAINARRRARVESMTDAELAERMERFRHYSREHRRRRRSDPAKAEADRIAYQEWKRRRRLGILQIEAGILLREARERIGEGKSRPAKACLVCGRPVIGRHPTALTCSRGCQRKRVLARLYPERPRPCVVCGQVFTAKTSALICSEACRKARKAEQSRNYKAKASDQRGLTS